MANQTTTLRECNEEVFFFQRSVEENEMHTLVTPTTTSNLMKEFMQEIRSPVTRICNIRLRVATRSQTTSVQLPNYVGEWTYLVNVERQILSEGCLNQESYLCFWIILKWSLFSVACSGKLGMLDGQVPEAGWSKYPKKKKQPRNFNSDVLISTEWITV